MLVLTGSAGAQTYPGNGTWSPPAAASYGEATIKDQPITMSDGVTLSADITYPTDLNTGAAAPGPFPVLLELTPYAKDVPGLAGAGFPTSSFTPYGYIFVIVDVRGTGASGGSFDLQSPRSREDALEVIDWAAKLPHSTGKVGMLGGSYLAMTALMAAGDEHPGSPLKAIFPGAGPSDLYRDLVVPGGMFNTDFDVPYTLGLEVGLDTAGPLFGPPDPQSWLSIGQSHLQGNLSTDIEPIVQGELANGPERYDGTFWQQRQPSTEIGRIAANGVAAFVYNVWFDIWARGDARVYDELQNGAVGRTPDSPMLPNQHADPRLQVAIGPYTHIGPPASELALVLEWFDTWLKGMNTGMADTTTPLHAYEVLGDRWIDAATWPLPKTTMQTYYFGPGRTGTAPSLNAGSLSPNPPPAGGSDAVPWVATNSPCSRSTDQNLVNGPVKGVGDAAGFPTDDPCFFDDRTLEAQGLTYTTVPMQEAVDIDGPIGVTIYASSNTTQTEWIATADVVSPNGASRPLATGDLLGSLRQVDPSLSWTLDGKVVAPGHPYTQASNTPVTPGTVTKYELEIPGILARIDRGDRLRITINSSDTPYVLPTISDFRNLWGGIYHVLRSPQYPSSVNVPLVDPRTLTTSKYSWGDCVTDCGDPQPLEPLPQAHARNPSSCTEGTKLSFVLNPPRHARVLQALMWIDGKLAYHYHGRSLRKLSFRRPARQRFSLEIFTKLSDGERWRTTAFYNGCKRSHVKSIRVGRATKRLALS